MKKTQFYVAVLAIYVQASSYANTCSVEKAYRMQGLLRSHVSNKVLDVVINNNCETKQSVLTVNAKRLSGFNYIEGNLVEVVFERGGNLRAFEKSDNAWETQFTYEKITYRGLLHKKTF